MIILGAGASYDSVDLRFNPEVGNAMDFRPPVAAELFGPRETFTPVVERSRYLPGIISRLRRVVHDEEVLEEVLRDLQAEAAEYPPRNPQLLAIQVYLEEITFQCGNEWRRRARNVTNFDELIDHVDRWRHREREKGQDDRVAFVTFNYDTMLEDALALRYGWTPTRLQDYLDIDGMSVLKLHGSVGWARTVEGRVEAARMVDWLWDNAGRYVVGDICFEGSRGVRLLRNEHGLIPAIAIPIQGKDSFECPEAHVERMKAYVRETTKVITIGWRGMEAHFLEPWTTRNQAFDLLVVAGSLESSTEAHNNMSNGGLEGESPQLHDGGFSDALAQRAIQNFLFG